LIRTPVENVRTTGRSAQGVTIFKVGKDENVVSVAWLVQEDDESDDPLADALEGEAVEVGAETPEAATEATEE
jgi:DNA gyrase subunit A